MRLSVILPVFNAEAFIQQSLARLEVFLTGGFDSFEIIAVDDGSQDATLARLRAVTSPYISVVSLPQNRGKFAAIKAGVRVAKGSCILFTDADIPYDLEALPYMEQLINGRGFHLAIGDRGLPGSIYRELLPMPRRFCTDIFSHAVRLLVTGGLFDTQCGLKALRADVCREIFDLLTEDRFAADVEMLYIALKYNLEIRRMPVRLQRQGPSTVRSLRDGLKMLLTIVQLRGNWRSGRYRSEVLLNISKQFYWEG